MEMKLSPKPDKMKRNTGRHSSVNRYFTVLQGKERHFGGEFDFAFFQKHEKIVSLKKLRENCELKSSQLLRKLRASENYEKIVSSKVPNF